MGCFETEFAWDNLFAEGSGHFPVLKGTHNGEAEKETVSRQGNPLQDKKRS